MKYSISVLLFVIGSSSAFSQNELHDKIPFDTSVRFGKLPNGFTYYLRKSKQQENQTYFQLGVKTGNLYERTDQLGLAHLLEHMGFLGMAHFRKGAWEFTRNHGLPDESLSAHTGDVETYYQLKVDANQLTYLTDSALLLMHDWASGMLLVPEQIDTERYVVVSELRPNGSGKTDSLLSHGKRRRAAPTIANVKNFKHESLISFYKNWYTADRQVAIVVGDIDVAELESKIFTMFSDLKPSDSVANDDELLNQHRVILDGSNGFLKNSSAGTQIDITIFAKGSSDTRIPCNVTRSDYREKIVDDLYSMMINKRLLWVNENLAAAQVSNAFIRHTTPKEELMSIMRTDIALNSNANIECDFKNALLSMRAIKQNGFIKSELESAKKALSKKYDLKEMFDAQALVFKYYNRFIYGAAAPNPAYEYKMIVRLINDVTVKDLNLLAAKWFERDKNLDVVVTGPEQEIKPLNRELIFRWIREARKMKAGQVRPAPEPVDKLIPDDISLSMDTVEKYQTKEYGGGLRELKLPNGVTVLLKSLTCTKAPIQDDWVRVHGFSEGGLNLYNELEINNARHATTIINNVMGIGGFNAFQVTNFWMEKRMSSGSYLSPNTAEYFGAVPVENMEDLLQCMYLTFSAPGKDKKAFKNYVDRQFSLTKDSSLLQLDVDAVYKIFKERFSNASGFNFIVTGNFDLDKATQMSAKYLGALKFRVGTIKQQTNITEKVLPKAIKRVTQNSTISSAIRLEISGPFLYNDVENMKLNVLNTLLHTRLTNRLRRKEGGTYGVFTSYFSDPKRYEFEINFETDVSQVDMMIKATAEEIEAIKNGEFSDQEFQNAVAMQREKNESDLQNSRFWLSYLVNQSRYGRDLNAVLNKANILNTLTSAEVQKSAIEYLRSDFR